VHSLCGGGADALVDGECLPQICGGLAGVAVLKVGLAESVQSACVFQRGVEVVGDGQRLTVALKGAVFLPR